MLQTSSHLNEAVGSWLIRAVFLQVITAAKDAGVLRTLDDSARPVFAVGDHALLPTRTIKPVGLPLSAFPTLVVHVAARHKAWPDVLERTREWMAASTTVQAAAGVVVRGKATRQVVWLTRLASGQVAEQLVDFHDASPSKPCDVSLPLAALYAGVKLPPALEGHADVPIKLDLAELLAYIEKLERQSAD
ncbi:hypothetical protein PINS_up010677 [Pythium insidiosum]|nr:hypothetical protein PINS_up010677 [Pythium insidiosum]